MLPRKGGEEIIANNFDSIQKCSVSNVLCGEFLVLLSWYFEIDYKMTTSQATKRKSKISLDLCFASYNSFETFVTYLLYVN